MKNTLIVISFQAILLAAFFVGFRVLFREFIATVKTLEVSHLIRREVPVEIRHSLIRVSNGLDSDFILIVSFPESLGVDVEVSEKAILIGGLEVYKNETAIDVYSTDVFPVADGSLQLVIKFINKESELSIDGN